MFASVRVTFLIYLRIIRQIASCCKQEGLRGLLIHCTESVSVTVTPNPTLAAWEPCWAKGFPPGLGAALWNSDSGWNRILRVLIFWTRRDIQDHITLRLRHGKSNSDFTTTSQIKNGKIINAGWSGLWNTYFYRLLIQLFNTDRILVVLYRHQHS